jgi:hypothetical protein
MIITECGTTFTSFNIYKEQLLREMGRLLVEYMVLLN